MVQSGKALVDGWDVTVSPALAWCGMLNSGETFTAEVRKSVVGYRVSERWSDGVTDVSASIPYAVRRTAQELAGLIEE